MGSSCLPRISVTLAISTLWAQFIWRLCHRADPAMDSGCQLDLSTCRSSVINPCVLLD